MKYLTEDLKGGLDAHFHFRDPLQERYHSYSRHFQIWAKNWDREKFWFLHEMLNYLRVVGRILTQDRVFYMKLLVSVPTVMPNNWGGTPELSNNCWLLTTLKSGLCSSFPTNKEVFFRSERLVLCTFHRAKMLLKTEKWNLPTFGFFKNTGHL